MVGRKCREARVPSCEARCHFHWWAAPVAQGRPMNAGLDPFAQGPHGACDRGSRGATAVRILCRSTVLPHRGVPKLAQVGSSQFHLSPYLTLDSEHSPKHFGDTDWGGHATAVGTAR